MTVRRIIPNLNIRAAAGDRESIISFYKEVLDLDLVMDLGWVVTLAAPTTAPPQLSVVCIDHSDGLDADWSIEVEDVDAVHDRARSHGAEILFAPKNETWGVRRFFMKDPSGLTLNILSHL